MNTRQIIFILAGLFFFVFQLQAFAASNPVSGYAWSENIGWIHFNPTFGGVFFNDTSGRFSGYGWSENIGWVDFGSASGYPSAPNYGAMADIVTGLITGWSKAVAGGSSGSGGWDGWIRTRGSGPDYGASADLITGDLSGWVWGSDVVGWVSLSGVTIGAGGGNYKVSMPPVLTEPAAPTDLLPDAGEGMGAGEGAQCETIDLVWEDNADNETSYKIERKTDGAFSEIASLPANTISYTNFGLDGGVTYAYRVRAANSIGYSDYSNEASATAVACAFFTLDSSGAIYATLVGDTPAISSGTTITVSPQGGFNENVTLSSNVSSVISGATGDFSDAVLEPSEYSEGAEFRVTIPAGTAKGLYGITITGTAQSFSGTLDINLNVESLNPRWREI